MLGGKRRGTSAQDEFQQFLHLQYSPTGGCAPFGRGRARLRARSDPVRAGGVDAGYRGHRVNVLALPPFVSADLPPLLL